jgi:hypothetical protein
MPRTRANEEAAVIHYVIGGFVLLVIYVLIVTVSPIGGCGKCGGTRVVERRAGVARRKSVRPCPRCKATGRAYRRGAVLVHRLLREHAGPWVRDRFRDAVARRTGDGS